MMIEPYIKVAEPAHRTITQSLRRSFEQLKAASKGLSIALDIHHGVIDSQADQNASVSASVELPIGKSSRHR